MGAVINLLALDQTLLSHSELILFADIAMAVLVGLYRHDSPACE